MEVNMSVEVIERDQEMTLLLRQRLLLGPVGKAHIRRKDLKERPVPGIQENSGLRQDLIVAPKLRWDHQQFPAIL